MESFLQCVFGNIIEIKVLIPKIILQGILVSVISIMHQGQKIAFKPLNEMNTWIG